MNGIPFWSCFPPYNVLQMMLRQISDICLSIFCSVLGVYGGCFPPYNMLQMMLMQISDICLSIFCSVSWVYSGPIHSYRLGQVSANKGGRLCLICFGLAFGVFASASSDKGSYQTEGAGASLELGGVGVDRASPPARVGQAAASASLLLGLTCPIKPCSVNS